MAEREVEILSGSPFPEAHQLTRLAHPNVAVVHELGERDGRPFVARELVQGRAINRLVIVGRMGLAELLQVVLPVVDGLAAAHELGVPHRDLEPANVLVDGHGRVKIVGFRLCPLLDDPARTPHHRSPEQLRGAEGDERSDVFSLGVILFELATGVRPFDGPTHEQVRSAVLRTKPLAPDRIDPQLSPELSRIILKALDKNPKRRYPSAVELRADLVRLEETSEQESERELPPGLLARRDGQRFVALGIGALAVLAVLWALLAGD
jgi:serine/threonine protein kinase